MYRSKDMWQGKSSSLIEEADSALGTRNGTRHGLCLTWCPDSNTNTNTITNTKYGYKYIVFASLGVQIQIQIQLQIQI